MSWRFAISACLFTLSLSVYLSGPVLAQNCAPRDLVTAIDMTPSAGRMLISVGINGTNKMLLLDSAAGLSTLDPGTVAALQLHAADSNGARLLDAKGNASHLGLTIASFRIGDLLVKNQPLMVAPDAGSGFDGSLGVDLLKNYDVELDFAEQQIKLFTPIGCNAGTIPWKASEIARIAMVVEDRRATRSRDAPAVSNTIAAATPSRGSHFMGNVQTDMVEAYTPGAGSGLAGFYLKIPVTIDGKDFTAMIDTGAPLSTMTADTAKAVYGVTADSPGSRPAGIVAPGQTQGVSETVTVTGSRIFEHVFHNLSLGGIAITDPPFIVRPQETGANDHDNSFQTGSHIYRLDDAIAPDITIGLDVLKQLHLYIGFQDKVLYLTQAKS